MQDDQMLTDLRALNYQRFLEYADKLEKSSVFTYSDLFRLLRDETADIALRRDICWTLTFLHKIVDGRKAVPILLKLLLVEDDELRRAAILTIGYWRTKRVANVLLEILTNPSASFYDREAAVHSLSSFKDEWIKADFDRIMHDEAEDIRLRALAIEWSPHYVDMVEQWIPFLSHESADLRFWASYRLAHPWEDIEPALATIDQVTAFDHAVPQSWGWHVDRELLRALEHIYSIPIRKTEYPKETVENLPSYGMYLISPTAEYETYTQTYRKHNEGGFYDTLPEPAVELRIEPEWLRGETKKAWSGVNFDVRQPKPQTYVLDWHVKIDGQNLLGGLHRDQYAVVLSGRDAAIYAFAAWYRSIIRAEHRLYLYQWADEGVELASGMTAGDVERMIEKRDEARRVPAL